LTDALYIFYSLTPIERLRMLSVGTLDCDRYVKHARFHNNPPRSGTDSVVALSLQQLG
jgi:hypothetical protein